MAEMGGESGWGNMILGQQTGFTQQIVPDKETFTISLDATLRDSAMNREIKDYARRLAEKLFTRVRQMTATPATREAYRLAQIDKIFEPRDTRFSSNVYDAAKALVIEAWEVACDAQRDHEMLSGDKNQVGSKGR
jgi:hypothetical protein